MLLAGKSLQYGDVLTPSQKRYLVQRVGSLARHLQSRGYTVEMKPSLRTDSVYLVVGDAKISFRNHKGGTQDYNVFLSSFPSWKDVKKHVLIDIIPKLPTPNQSVIEVDIFSGDEKKISKSFPVFDKTHIEQLDELKKNIHSLHRFVTPNVHLKMDEKEMEELKKSIAATHSSYDKYRNKVNMYI